MIDAADSATADDVKLAAIIGFVADAADCEIATVSPDSDIYNELGVDSLGAMAIFIDMAFEFSAPEPPEQFDFAAVNTPRKLLDYVNAAHARA
ncbi:acyl carrier protein [Mesorhizobium sp. M1060]|uniref:acyl carrier protein n=1 Tax=Mesorhizobium sp. M1060 TaxID=2957052 RepID=UPI003336ED15